MALVSLLVWSTTAYGQTAPGVAPSMKQAPTQTSVFRSAFEGYQPYVDDGTSDWKKANDAVGQIGGWRAYAREAQGAQQSQPGQPRPAPAAPTAQPDPHAGHAKP